MRYNIILFGAGYWGKNHLRELTLNERVKSVFVIDPYYDKNPDLVKNYPDTLFFKSFEEFSKKQLKADGAIIATPPNSHFEIAKNCLDHNLHVLVEKPMVENLKQLEILQNSAKNKVLMSGHTYLYNPAIKKIKQIVDSGDLGEIMFIHSQRLNFGIMRDNIDVFESLAPHDISLVQFFMNDKPYEKISNNKSNYTFSPHNDFSSTHIEYQNKVFAKIDVSWYYPEKVRKLTILGKEKTIVFDDVSKKIFLYHIKIDSNYNHINDGVEDIEFDNELSPLTNEINSFISYFDNPLSCITGYNHTKNVISVLEHYNKI